MVYSSYDEIARVFFQKRAMKTATTQTWRADNGNGTFSNPLFYDEFSDPDLIRVGSDFYLTGTTMHAMPGLPVLHSKDLVNWRFLSYACQSLDFGPEYRLENGKEIYGQGIWAPSFRWHKGTFYIFTNVRGQPMQVFSATDPRGPWKQSVMKRGFHDPSVLFDDDGRIWVVWGYRDLRLAQLNSELTDAIAGTERVLFKQSDGMGEGAHFYKLNGKYFITSAWYLGTMKMPCARADRPEGPYEVKDISVGEDFGIAKGAMHQGGIVETPVGEWWGFSMMDFNSLGRLTGLSPVTWKDGWPYFGLSGNLGRSPRTWVKPKTGAASKPTAPYERSDDFSGKTLKPIWQWNHAPDNAKWSLTERPGFLRLHALPAPDFWQARNSLTQRAIGPISIPTVELEIGGMKPGDLAGLGLLNSPYAWIGVRCEASGFLVEHFDKTTGKTTQAPLRGTRLWLRAECDFFTEKAQFSFSTTGKSYQPLGDTFKMVFQLKTFQGVRYALFHYSTAGAAGGHADFTRFTVDEPLCRGLTKSIPYGKTITLTEVGSQRVLTVGTVAQFKVLDLGQGRVALQSAEGFVSVQGSEPLALRRGKPTESETFQWIETPQGELTLLSLSNQRYLRLALESKIALADGVGIRRSHPDGSLFRW
jgi:xylan 1,4-beta-xylosidase